MDGTRALAVRVLGPLEVSRDGQPVPVAGSKPRALLGLLGLNVDRMVAADVLLELLWGDDPPRTASKALLTHVSALRRSLGDGVIVTSGGGWRLVGAGTDVARFSSAAAAGRDAARAGDVSTAVAEFSAALDLWRGPPELPDTPSGAAEVARWVEQRETLVDDRTDALLASGAGADLVGELEALVAQTPLRERRWGQLMLALYRAGRQADALAAYQRARTLLNDELGVEPGPQLRGLEAAILDHDPTLNPPPARTETAERPAFLEHASGALPAQWTTFVGRRRELLRIDELLRSHALTTVVGPGGVGKTRLAVTAAESAARLFRAGVAFVDLSPVTPAFVMHAAAAALGVSARPQQPIGDAVHDHIGRGRWLLVLDNCEHVIDAVAEFVEGLRAGCPRAAVLATSRERLGIRGEQLVAVPPLEVVSPDTGERVDSEAVRLFTDRTRESVPDFDVDPKSAGELCTRLDGLPLAIELAAAQCVSLGIDAVVAALDDRLPLSMSTRGGPQRHRSLRAVLDWSYDLLDDAERATLRRVAVFAGEFDLAAAVAVICGDDEVALPPLSVPDLVQRLVEKNLLAHRRRGTRSRWRLLEIVRVYSRERLAGSGEEPVILARFARWAATTAEELERRLAENGWRDDFDAVVDDLRSAMESGGNTGGRLGSALGHLCYARGNLPEAREHYQRAAAHTTGAAAEQALRAAAGVAFAEMRHDISFDLLIAAAEQSAEAGDRVAEATTVADAVVLAARCPGGFPSAIPADRLAALLDRAKAATGNSAVAAAHVAEAIAWTANPVRARCDGALGEAALAQARIVDDPVLLSTALDGVTTVALGEGRFRKAAGLAAQRLDLLDRLPRHNPAAGGEIVDIFHMATETALAAGDLPGALATARRARQDSLGSGVPLLPPSRLVLSIALIGGFSDALAEADRMRQAWIRNGRPPAGWMAPACYAAAMACWLIGEDDGGRQWAEQALALTTDPRVQGFAPFVDCRIALHAGHVTEAVDLAAAMPTAAMGKFDAYARAIAAEAAVVAGLPDAAERLAAAAPAGEENAWAAACLARAHARLHDDDNLLEQSIAAWERIDAGFERACTLLLIDGRAGEGRAELEALGCPQPAVAS